ncbi:MAG: ABC transporter ATP-binding protein [Candidatus Puniceispirillaceae bacterium]|nr:MAG: lipoprotein-releasing system ATP-binding protein LolD [Alphaproteobacteria bacterium]
MSEQKHILKLEMISHGYVQAGRQVDVLSEASLMLHPGRITALVGPSGAGKTTLLNLAGLLEQPKSGQIWINGTKATGLSERKRTQLRRRHIGMVFQFHRLFPEFSALENIMIPQMLNGLSQTESEKRAKLLLEMVGLSDRATHRPGLLSGGEQQRVAIARSVANAPDILLADEPTGNLDPETGETVFQSLQRIVHGTDTAALIVTHNQKLAAKMDEILELENGNIKRKQLL